MILWNGNEPEEEAPAEKIHIVVHKSAAGGMIAEFRSASGELGRPTGPRVPEILAWIMAHITDPFTRVIRKDHNPTEKS